MSRNALVWMLAALLAGCAVLEPLRPPVDSGSQPAPEAPTDVQALLRQAAEFTRLGATEQEQRLTGAARRYEDEPSLPNATGYVVLLAVTNPEHSEVIAARDALREQLDRPGSNRGRGGLASLAVYLLQLMERRAELLERNSELQQKLEQLKAIEQKLREREEPGSLPMTQ